MKVVRFELTKPLKAMVLHPDSYRDGHTSPAHFHLIRVKTGLEPVSRHPQCRMLAFTTVSPYVRQSGFEPKSSVWKTDMLPLTPLTHVADKNGVEPLTTVLQTAALPLELLVHFCGRRMNRTFGVRLNRPALCH